MSILPVTRCPFCHQDVIAGQDDQHGCEKCRAWHHKDCWVEHQGCSACDFKIATFSTHRAIQDKTTRPLKDILKDAARAIKTFPEYEEVYGIAKANCELPIYLVGGRVYRSIASSLYEIEDDETEFGIYGTDPFGSRDCDWDFLTTGFLGKANHTPNKWCYTVRDAYSSYAASPYQIKKDSSLVRWKKVELRNDNYTGQKKEEDEVLCKIDLININRIVWENKGLKPPSWYQFWKPKFPEATLEDYFQTVPLDIQAIAFDPVKEIFKGKGIQAVVDRKIKTNNLASLQEVAHRKLCEPVDFLRKKAQTMVGFKFEMDKSDR